MIFYVEILTNIISFVFQYIRNIACTQVRVDLTYKWYTNNNICTLEYLWAQHEHNIIYIHVIMYIT